MKDALEHKTNKMNHTNESNRYTTKRYSTHIQ